MKVGVFHPGVQHSRQTALALQQLGRLQFLATGLFDHEGSAARRMAGLLPSRMANRLEGEFARFAFPALDPGKVRAFPPYELPERLVARMGAEGLAGALNQRLNVGFGKKVAALARREGPIVLWGYDGSSASAFTDPRTAGCPKILDRTTADCRSWNAQREVLLADYGDWLEGGSQSWDAVRIARDEQEYAAADAIVCGSPFVMESIRKYSSQPGIADKLQLLPYCYDSALFAHDGPPRTLPKNEPVRFLYVGHISARKGVQHALEAIACIPESAASLTMVGPIGVPDKVLAPYRDRVTFTGPVSRAEVPSIMRDHHAFVFPSYNEGSAIALLEAMASGLAIVQTAASGLGASEESGIVLDRPDSGQVQLAMETLIGDRDLLQSMRKAALEEAESRDFAAYRNNIARLLERMEL